MTLERTVVAVFYNQTQHGGAEHLADDAHIALLGRQIFAGEQRVFEQVAHQHAQIGFRQGKLVGQIQIPVNGNLLLRSPERIIARDSVHGGVGA